jgi:hypothetical protein
VTRISESKVVAPGSPNFALYTLGWRAFQDLCAAVLRQVWGQSMQTFADSNDAGRDGAFYGSWSGTATGPVQDVPEGPFVLQCKHTKNPDATLSASMLHEEFDKAQNLVRRGLCRSYLLLTNARVTGASEATIRERLIACGVAHPLILDGQWICDMISTHRNLRMYVPRVYGLGDLSQILDERVYAQTSMLMASARDQVAAFVATSAYRRAAHALQHHGFVLLLGEPAVGKSIIALMLAITAADNWGCLSVKARTSNELVDRWNPHEKNQFFWVDDAFGSVRHEEHLTHGWARDLPQVMSAIAGGARVVLTSRSYIYSEARPLLKTYAYPILQEQEVVVDVSDISLAERQHILYNHLEAGDQPAEIRALMKPYLEAAAEVVPFRPEAARRLGQRAFTRNLAISLDGIRAFIAHPHQFLDEIYDQLDTQAQAALVVVFMAPQSHLACHLKLQSAQREIIKSIGTTVSTIGKLLATLVGTFLREEVDIHGQRYWAFKHPTLREGFAAWLSNQHYLVPIVFKGIDDDALLELTDCLPPEAERYLGTTLRLPPLLYKTVAGRLAALFEEWPDGSCWTGAALRYLENYCSEGMLSVYLTRDPLLPARLIKFKPFARFVPEPWVLARLHRVGLLSKTHRQQAIDRMAELAVSFLDATWIEDACWKILLTDRDRARLFAEVRDRLVPRLQEAVQDDWTKHVYWRGEDAASDEIPIEQALQMYRRGFEEINDEETARAFSEAIEYCRHIEVRPAKTSNASESRAPYCLADDSVSESSRSAFADIDEEV